MPASRAWKIISRNSLRALCALALTTLCCGCFQSLGNPPDELLHTDLPPAPAFAKPATVPEPRLGAKEPLEVIAHRERAGRLYNARVITCGTLWYETVRNVHAQKADESELARIEAECVKKPLMPAKKQQQKAAPKPATS